MGLLGNDLRRSQQLFGIVELSDRAHGGQRKYAHASGCGKQVVSKGLCMAHGGAANKYAHANGCVKNVVRSCTVRMEASVARKCNHASGCGKNID